MTTESTNSNKRDFLILSGTAALGVSTCLSLWPFIDNMNPSADVLALSSVEIDLSPIEEGQSITVKWRGKPVFIRYRTGEEIARATQEDSATNLLHVEKDIDRVIKKEWLVVIGVCTHLGCVPVGQKSGDKKGDYGGWFCPCHGSHYDISGRIRKGPAPRNLDVPSYVFLEDKVIKIG